MKEKLVSLLEIFLKEHFIPSVIAVVLAFITYYFTPTDNPVLVKFTVTGYAVFIFLVWFLITKVVILALGKIVGWLGYKIYLFRSFDDRNEEIKKHNKEALEPIWSIVDTMNPNDYKILLDFINNGNQPYYLTGYVIGEGLLNSGWVHKSQVQEENINYEPLYRYSNSGMVPIPMPNISSERYQYVLREDIYQSLKYSMDTYGRISHFDK